MSIGLSGPGMHDFILRELEIGYRAAAMEDSERCGWNAIHDLQYEEYCRREDAAYVEAMKKPLPLREIEAGTNANGAADARNRKDNT